MARLIESSLRMPNVQEGGRHYATPSGFPSTATLQAGGVYKVEVSSLAVRGGEMLLGNDSEVGYDDVPSDAFGRAAALNNTFREFAYNTIGRVRIQEGFGPMSSGRPTAVGTRGDDFPHSPSYGARRVPSYYRGPPRPSYSRGRGGEVRDHPNSPCHVAHPGFSHDDWADQGGEEELNERRQRTRILEAREAERHESRMAAIEQKYYSGFLPHWGLMSDCTAAHPGQTHSAWRSS